MKLFTRLQMHYYRAYFDRNFDSKRSAVRYVLGPVFYQFVWFVYCACVKRKLFPNYPRP